MRTRNSPGRHRANEPIAYLNIPGQIYINVSTGLQALAIKRSKLRWDKIKMHGTLESARVKPARCRTTRTRRENPRPGSRCATADSTANRHVRQLSGKA